MRQQSKQEKGLVIVMNLQEMFAMQKELDRHIVKKHHLEHEDLFDRKILALFVEIGELANETRCFKYWSLKPSSPQEVVLEEYVDGIHFLLSLGIECGMEDVEEITPAGGNVSLSEQFVKVYEAVCSFRSAKNRSSYINMLSEYLLLGKLLGFSPEAVKEAYIMKNKVNFERQEKGY